MLRSSQGASLDNFGSRDCAIDVVGREEQAFTGFRRRKTHFESHTGLAGTGSADEF